MAVTDSFKGHLTLTDRPLGEYVAELELQPRQLMGTNQERLQFSLDIDQLLTIRQHLDNVLESLRLRQKKDAVCGNCRTCKNVRMVQALQPAGRGSWTEHCPVCHPKIEDARSKGLLA